MTTRKELRHAIDTNLRLVHASPVGSGTATGGSSEYLVDDHRAEPDRYWDGSWLYIATTTDGLAPQGEEVLVDSYRAYDAKFTFSGPLSAEVQAGDTYELRRYFSAAMIHQAIDMVLEESLYQFPQIQQSSDLVVVSDRAEYTVPSGVDYILRVDVVEHTVEYQGAATGGSSSTLVDSSRNWPAGGLVGMEVALYDGPGAGQRATVTANTADTLTVSPSWAVAPASGTRYVVKDVSEEPAVRRVTRVSRLGNLLVLRQALPAGQKIRITYVPEHSALASDSATTAVPKTYVVLRATQHLLLMAPVVLPEAMREAALALHDRLEIQLQRYLTFAKRPQPPGTWWNRGQVARKRLWTIGTREEL
jgi:hypothetical protein